MIRKRGGPVITTFAGGGPGGVSKGGGNLTLIGRRGGTERGKKRGWEREVKNSPIPQKRGDQGTPEMNRGHSSETRGKAAP